MSPAKVQTFLLNWLPRKVMLSFAEQDAMPHVLAAWVRWAGRKRGLEDAVVAETLEAVFNSISMFAEAYRDPAEFGLDYALVRRLLPDGDLEALPRRAFAFPVLDGWHSGTDLSSLDPADPRDRRALLAADHATPAPGGVGRHIERHLILADRLWRGDPPELWEAAQRLLDAGQDRHLVLHALMAVLDHTSGDEAALIAVLRELDADERLKPPRAKGRAAAWTEERRGETREGSGFRAPGGERDNTVAAAARGVHDEDVAGADLDAVAAAHAVQGAVRVLDPVAAQGARLAARHAERGDAAVPGQGGDGHRRGEAQPPDAAVPAMPAARAAAAGDDPVGLQQHRVPPLQHLGVGEPGVGHLGLHHVGAVKAGPAPEPLATVS